MKHMFSMLILCSMPIIINAQSKRKIEKVMNSWMGSSKQEIILNFGPPDRIASDGAKGEILIFSQQLTEGNPSLGTDINGNLQLTEGMPFVYYRHLMFYTDSSGIAYYWHYKKNRVPPQQLQLNVNGNINHYIYK